MNKGDVINLRNGLAAVITGLGIGDFPGDPFPVYYTIPGTAKTGWLMSDELKENTDGQ